MSQQQLTVGTPVRVKSSRTYLGHHGKETTIKALRVDHLSGERVVFYRLNLTKDIVHGAYYLRDELEEIITCR